MRLRQVSSSHTTAASNRSKEHPGRRQGERRIQPGKRELTGILIEEEKMRREGGRETEIEIRKHSGNKLILSFNS